MDNVSSNLATDYPPYVIPSVDYLFGAICFLCFFIGVPANIFAFWCFLAQRRSVSSIVYTCISAVDCLICVNCFPVAITYMALRDDIMFRSGVYCNIWGVAQRLLSSLSIFYVAVLSISRTFVLLLPFRRLKMEVVLVTIGVHFLLQCVVVSMPYWEVGGEFQYLAGYGNCEHIHAPLNKFEKPSDILNEIIYSIPIFPIILSCIVSVFILMRDADQLQDLQRNTKRYASVTIVLFTVVYIIFNLGSRILNNFKLIKKASELDPTGYLLNFLFYYTIILNAAVNPVLYMIRMHSLRTSVKSLVLKILSKGSITIDKNMLSIAPTAAPNTRLRISMKLRGKTRLNGCGGGGMGGFERNLTPRLGETVIIPTTPTSMCAHLGNTARLRGGLNCPDTPSSLRQFPLSTPTSHRRLDNIR